MFNPILPKKRSGFVAVVMMALAMAAYSFPTVCPAEEPGAAPGDSRDGSGAIFEIIQPPPKIDVEKPFKSGNISDFFDVTGNVTALETDFIMLGDRRFNMGEGVRITGIKRGDRVGLWLNKKGFVRGYEKLKYVPH